MACAGAVTAAKISYGLYLFHLPIYAAFGLAQSATGLPRWLGAAAVTTTFILAAVSFRLIEAPILTWVRQTPQCLCVRWGRCSLSFGSALSLGLAITVAWQVVQWSRDHAGVPWQYRYRAVTDDSGITGFYWMGIYHDLGPTGFRRSR